MSKNTLSVIDAVCDDFDGSSIESIGAVAALKAMVPYWDKQLADGRKPRIVSDDIDELRQLLEMMRAEIMRRVQTDELPALPAEITLAPSDI